MNTCSTDIGGRGVSRKSNKRCELRDDKSRKRKRKKRLFREKEKGRRKKE
jgi:hypothetical protein